MGHADGDACWQKFQPAEATDPIGGKNAFPTNTKQVTGVLYGARTLA